MVVVVVVVVVRETKHTLASHLGADSERFVAREQRSMRDFAERERTHLTKIDIFRSFSVHSVQEGPFVSLNELQLSVNQPTVGIAHTARGKEKDTKSNRINLISGHFFRLSRFGWNLVYFSSRGQKSFKSRNLRHKFAACTKLLSKRMRMPPLLMIHIKKH